MKTETKNLIDAANALYLACFAGSNLILPALGPSAGHFKRKMDEVRAAVVHANNALKADKPIGTYRFLLMHPNTYSTKSVYGHRPIPAHLQCARLVGCCQVLVETFGGDKQWINVSNADYFPAEGCDAGDHCASAQPHSH